MKTPAKIVSFKNIALILIPIFLCILPLLFPSPFFINSLILALLFGIASKGWDFLGGYAGQFSLGHAVFFGIGAYTTGIFFVKLGFSPWLSMLIGPLAGTVAAVLIGYPCFRFRGHFFVLATVAFGVVMQTLFLNWSYIGGAGGLWFPILPESLFNFRFKSKLPYYYFFLSVATIIALISYRIEKSRLNLLWKAIKGDEDAAASLGVNSLKYKLIAAAISGAMTGFAGSLYALYYLYIDPYAVMSFDISAMLVIISVIGGAGSLLGPFLGAFVYVPLSEYIRAMLGRAMLGFHLITFGTLLIMFALFLPKGLIGITSQLAATITRAIAPRQSQ